MDPGQPLPMAFDAIQGHRCVLRTPDRRWCAEEAGGLETSKWSCCTLEEHTSIAGSTWTGNRFSSKDLRKSEGGRSQHEVARRALRRATFVRKRGASRETQTHPF